MTRLNDVQCVDRVIRHLELTPAAYLSREQANQIRGYILETLEMIAPYRPSTQALEKLNSYLYLHKATQMQCIVAWTMFMDLRSLANLHDVPRGRANAA